jgi:ATP-dependent Clp protease, protease subunit
MKRRILLSRSLSCLVVVGLLVSAAPSRAAPPERPVTASTVAAASAPVDLHRAQEDLTLQTSVIELQQKKDLAALSGEKQRRELEGIIAEQRLKAEEAEAKIRLDTELASVRERLEKLRAENDLAAAQLTAQSRVVALNEEALRLKKSEMELRNLDYEDKIAKLDLELKLKDAEDKVHDRVLAGVSYTTDVFKNGVLTISDRRIPLDGVITEETADRIAERVNYFNNQSKTYPIFLVIEASPGGSVLAGFKILETMKGSHAPVYVVVKSFAASMAAGITTLAPRSFAYPNAIILHHQISAGAMGNLTEQRENVREMEEWWRRIGTPVAQKMGIGLDELVRRMYAQRSTGDWMEFGDAAKKLRWVDDIASVIQEDSYVKNPDTSPAGSSAKAADADGGAVGVDAQGHAFARLPRLSPVDVYDLYDPGHYYRLVP